MVTIGAAGLELGRSYSLSRHAITDACDLYLQIKDAIGNDHGRPKDIAGETRQAFTSPAETAFDVCFENQLISRSTFLTFSTFPLSPFMVSTAGMR